MALKGLFAGAVLLILLASLDELPVHRPVREIAVILGIEIGGDVLRVPAEIVAEQEIGERSVASDPLACVDSESLQCGLLRRRCGAAT